MPDVYCNGRAGTVVNTTGAFKCTTVPADEDPGGCTPATPNLYTIVEDGVPDMVEGRSLSQGECCIA